jgi:hypothetical protein
MISEMPQRGMQLWEQRMITARYFDIAIYQYETITCPLPPVPPPRPYFLEP